MEIGFPVAYFTVTENVFSLFFIHLTRLIYKKRSSV